MADANTLNEIPGTPAPSIGVPPSSASMPVVQILSGYLAEARLARNSGDNPRDQKWRENVDLYWGRYDFSKKAAWQAKEVMPDVAGFVDRFAAAMKQSLLQDENYYTMEVPGDAEKDLAIPLKKMMDLQLGQCGVDASGHNISLPSVFEDLMKLGAMMTCAAAVTWKKPTSKPGFVAIEPIDPRMVWLDATGRGLYRIRRITVDKSYLLGLKNLTDGSGEPLYDLAAIDTLAASIADTEVLDKQKLSGTGTTTTAPSNRKEITLDEYLCTLVDSDGTEIASNVLCVVADDRTLIRGPEENPYWHEQDWVVSAPVVSVPLSPYGRAYMEDFGTLARAYNEMSNLILDAAQTSAVKAFAMNPEMLIDPAQATQGVYPNVTFQIDGDPKAFLNEIDLGVLDQGAVMVWGQLKEALREASAFNELGLGQLAPRARTSAAEIMTTQSNSSAFMASLASNIETRILEPILNLVWMTFLQHMPKPGSKDAVGLEAVAGVEMYAAIFARRKELVQRPVTFQARGISRMIAKASKFRNLVQVLGIISQSEPLMQVLFQKYDPAKIVDYTMRLNDIDTTELELSPRERMMQTLTQAPMMGAPNANGGDTGVPTGTPQTNMAADMGVMA